MSLALLPELLLLAWTVPLEPVTAVVPDDMVCPEELVEELVEVVAL
jgi:hypothetical protein